MNLNPQHLSDRLDGAVDLAVTLLGLPLDARQIQALALELSGPVRALLAEALAAAEDAPVGYTLTDAPRAVTTTEYAGCTTRIADDVDIDSPAAALAAELRASQPDVTATDIPTATYLGLTVRPQSVWAWRWWLNLLAIGSESVSIQGTTAYAVGSRNGVAVHLRGDGVPELLADTAAAGLMGVLAPTAP